MIEPDWNIYLKNTLDEIQVFLNGLEARLSKVATRLERSDARLIAAKRVLDSALIDGGDCTTAASRRAVHCPARTTPLADGLSPTRRPPTVDADPSALESER